MGRYLEGQWVRPWFWEGNDSTLHGIRHNFRAPYQNIKFLSLGMVLYPQPEPVFKQHTVMVEMVTGGRINNVAWPGAQVNANATGTLPGGVAAGIHGLWESPLSGQMVLVGFVDGSHGNPIVINKYPYNASQRPDLDVMHTLPLTGLGHGPRDVILGHHTGSFVALRGTLPLPGQVDIEAVTTVAINAKVSITMKALASMSANALSITLESNTSVSIQAKTKIQTVLTTGDKIVIEPGKIQIADATGMGVRVEGGQVILKTGDAAPWKPNILPKCAYTGIDHCTIFNLKGE